ncbi:HlyD family efflux transporter periplasmic adaptor subunit [Dyadobacter sp. CY261]|uniref:HlyD family secretion protein n=1 Tax=Dyadobacter sp. CY261 TaxID=2907203 RepID=UPI001F44661C|nr:HlyD family efflux transporter periplasmic adaptor subunit [Dyadobacter sp. CY261]MCF0071001.1 HlyD family efflux transporter periplasmic adaptor subunit [Dyadobacter sp. CY261]
MKTYSYLIIMVAVLTACNGKENPYDASGTFEAVETIVSAEATGRIMVLNLEEGQQLTAGQTVGYIDSLQLYLRKKQLEAQIRATGSRVPDIVAQTNVYKQQIAVSQVRLDNLIHEQKRIQNLLKADAATPKQLDDINAQVEELQKQLEVIRKQDAAQTSVLKTQTSGLRADVLPLYVQIEQINDQLAKSRIINEVGGTVLTKYAEANEVATAGKPLYKIADLSTIILRAYVTGDQLTGIKLNQQVKVLVDDVNGKYRESQGTIEWISNKAEFTPKTIQTKDERANLVYAVKIRVKNDGYLKIGMYGEVAFK